MTRDDGTGTRQRATVLLSPDPKLRALQEQNGFADAIVIGSDVILSGVVTEQQAGDRNLEESYKRTLAAIGATLERAGATWDDVVEINTFHTDVNAQIASFVAAKNQFVRLPHPAWTAVGTTGLVGDAGVTETRVRARLRATAGS